MVSVRTLFLLVRGVDQTGRALTDPTRKLNEMEKAQQRLAQSGTRLMFAAVAFGAFALMIGGAILKTLESTTRGQRMMDSFSESVTRLTKSFANAVLRNFGDDLVRIVDAFDELSRNQGAMDFLARVGVGVTGFALGASILAAIGMFATKVGGFLLPYLLKGILGDVGGNAALATLKVTSAGAFTFIVPIAAAIVISWTIEQIFPEQAKTFNEYYNKAMKRSEQLGPLKGYIQGSPMGMVGAEWIWEYLQNTFGWGKPTIGTQQGGGYMGPQPSSINNNVFNFSGPINTKADTDNLDETFGNALKNVSSGGGVR